MMAEEDFDNDQNISPHQKQQHQQLKQNQTMFSPSNLTSKPNVTSSEASQIKEQPSGANPLTGEYYQNVKTKSKLILPTALWILIIVGGLCFLSLLSSLNKTLGTLDTLIEFEQNSHDQQQQQHQREREYQIDHHNELHHKHLNEIPSKSNKDRRDLPIAEKLQTSDSEGSHSWLSFPSWTSLEPVPKAHEKIHNELVETSGDENMAKSILDDVIKSINNGHHDGLIPIGGSVIIASSSSDGDRLNERGGPPKGFLSSIFDQFLGGPQGPLSMSPLTPVNEPPFGRRAPPMLKLSQHEQNNEPPLIHAKIDKINININTPADIHAQQDGFKMDGPDFGLPEESILGHPPIMNFKRTPSSNNVLNNDDNMLEKSIDTLMSKLIEPEQQVVPQTQRFFIPLDNQLGEPVRAGHLQHDHDEPLKHIHFHGDDDNIHKMPLSPLSPTSKLILPSSFLNDNDSPSMIPEGGLDMKPTMFLRPPETHEHFIIRLEPNSNNINENNNKNDIQPREPPMSPLKPSAPHTLLGPQPSSPYELLIPNGPPKMMIPTKPPTEDDLAESIAQSLFKAIQDIEADKPDPFPKVQIKPITPISRPIHPVHPSSQIPHPHPHPSPAPAPVPTIVPALEPTPTPAPNSEQGPETITFFSPSPMPMPLKPLPSPFGDSIIFMNGEPLISDEKQSLSLDEETPVPLIKAKDRNQVNDLFNLFFGPPPDSKLVVAQPQIIEPIKSDKKEPLPEKDEFSSSSLNQPIEVSKVNSKKLIDGDDKKKEEESPFEHELSDIFGQMLSLPQFSGQPGSQNVNTGRAAANATSKETMQCECHRLSTNSSAPSGGNSSSPRPPTAGGSGNSTNSGGPSSPNRPAGSPPGGSSGNSSGRSSGGSSGDSARGPSAGSSSGGGSASSNPPGNSSQQSGSSSSASSNSQRGSSSSSSSSPSGSSGSEGSSSGSARGSSGGSSSGSSGGSSGGGQQQRSPGQGLGGISPVGYVAAPPIGPPPVGYVALINESPQNELPLYTAGQQSGNTPSRQVGPGFARPGSMLSALNNSTEYDDSEEFDPADFQPSTDDAGDASDDSNDDE